MRIRLALLAISLLLVIPAAAHASLADEQRQGQDLIAQLRAGTRTCGDLSTDDFDHVGEYVMGRAVGSTATHAALNQRMRLMMGDQGESRMHQLMGARYVNCPLPGARSNYGYAYGGMMGPGMMGGGYGTGGWGPMMSSGAWSWMMNGAWQTMSRQDWQRLQQQVLGTTTSNGHNGPSGWMIATIALAALLLGGAIALLALRHRPSKRPPASTTPA